MARLDWQKARDRDLARAAKQAPSGTETGKSRAARQVALAAFVEKHEIACFECGAKKAEWAKTGISQSGRPWAICVRCVQGS